MRAPCVALVDRHAGYGRSQRFESATHDALTRAKTCGDALDTLTISRINGLARGNAYTGSNPAILLGVPMKVIEESEYRNMEKAYSVSAGVSLGFFAAMVASTFAFHGRLILILFGG